MDSLLIAHTALWLMILSVGVLVWLLSRQIGALHGRVAPAGALAVNAVLQHGEAAPEMTVATLTGRTVQVGGRRGRSQLLLFVAPDCPISRSLVPVLRTFARSERWLDLLLVSDGEEPAQRAFAAQPDLDGVDYTLSEALGRACGVSKVPYAVLIDEEGRVAGMGIVNSREHLESLFEAKERGIPSIQAFMAGHPEFQPADGNS